VVKVFDKKFMQTRLTRPFTISVFSPNTRDWRWYEADLPSQIQWRFTNEDLLEQLPSEALLRKLCRKLTLGCILGAWRTARQAQQPAESPTDLIVAHSVCSTLWVALWLQVLGVKTPLVSFSCHFERLPPWYLKGFWQLGFRRVQRFLVHSRLEQAQYAAYFGLPSERFQLVRWGVHPPQLEPQRSAPLPTPYICTVGKSGRDYRTLLAAMAQLPYLSLALVAQPYNLRGLTIPNNVRVFYDIPESEYLNILQHSLFLAIPLHHSHTPCGLMTIVAAQFCNKAVLITEAEAVQDYFPPDYPLAQVPPQDVQAWVQALQQVATDPALRQQCAQVGQAFAQTYCSHQASLQRCLAIFADFGLELSPVAPPAVFVPADPLADHGTFAGLGLHRAS
jgi:glycosyltransferase involved in cell wall biosynthesis